MKKLGILAIGIMIGNAITTQKYNNISDNLDMIISNQETIFLKTNELKIDSLYDELMYRGHLLDSMVLKYDEGWVF